MPPDLVAFVLCIDLELMSSKLLLLINKSLKETVKIKLTIITVIKNMGFIFFKI